ncbi:MAG: hypothetical protein JNM34_08225 [Chthonomonadaceae bacterium]|nr:hypothetical protein [Chthonomonadaceae bacterium]
MIATIAALTLLPLRPVYSESSTWPHLAPTVSVIGVREVRSVTLKKFSGTSLSGAQENKHALQVWVKIPQNLNDLGGGGFDNEVTGVAITSPCGVPTSVTSFGPVYSGGPNGVPVGTVGSGQEMTGYFYICLDDYADGETVNVYTSYRRYWHKWTGSAWDDYDQTTATGPIFTIAKHKLLSDGAIDSRVAWGKANDSGLVEFDANDDSPNPNFGDYKYKGGLFVGYMPYALTKDRSGMARVNLWPTTGDFGTTSQLLGMSVTLFDKGKAVISGQSGQTNSLHGNGQGVFADSPPLALYIPTADSAPVETEMQATWYHRTISDPLSSLLNPVTDVMSSRSANQGISGPWLLSGEDPLASDSGGEYINFQACWSQRGNETPSTKWKVIPEYGFTIGMPNESSYSGYGAAVWRYFASSEFESSSGNTFPDNDSAPRLWTLHVPGEW